MTGIQALIELSNGKKIRCVNWENPDWHFYFTDGCYFSHPAKEFPRVPDLNLTTPWTNMFNQEIAEELIDDILKKDWEILE
jgi:hypothetical protein